MGFKKELYVADFETCNSSQDTSKTRVWLSVVEELMTKKPTDISYDIEGFFKWLFSRPKATIYFHNLSFDGAFIISHLLRSGWKAISPKTKMADKTFTCIADDFGKVYMIKIAHQRGKTLSRYTIYDSYKIVPVSEAQLGEKWGLSTTKGEIDYRAYRPEGYLPTQEEISYCCNDVAMICEVLQYFISHKWLEGFTIGMIAFKQFEMTLPNWRSYFPLLQPEMDRFCRKAYRGGISYVNPKFKEKAVGCGQVFDANSLYPSQMLLKPMPIGMPVYFEGEPHIDPSKGRDLYIVHIVCAFKVKKDYIPMIQVKHNMGFNPSEFVTKSIEPIDLWLTNVDYDLFRESYEVSDLQFIEGYYFRSATGLFDDYIHQFQEIKENSTGALRQIAKLFLNNIYGKFGTNPIRHSRLPKLAPNGVVQFVDTGEEEVKAIYVPLACFVTAYGRAELCRNAHANWERFCYCDTDSIHILGMEAPDGVKIHQTHFGAWKCESTFDRAKFLRAKTYIEEKDGKLIVKCCGLPDKAKKQVTFDNFRIGALYTGKLARKTIEGGVILNETTFCIR